MVKQIFRRSICFAMAIFVLFSCSISANALSASEVSGLLTAVKDFGEWATPVITQAGNEIGSIFNGDICPGSSAGGGRHIFELTVTQVDGIPGNYYICKNCGKYAGDAFDDAYSSYVSGLDSSIVNSSGVLNWVDETVYDSSVSVGSLLTTLRYTKVPINSYSTSVSAIYCYFTVPVSGTYIFSVGFNSLGFGSSYAYLETYDADGWHGAESFLPSIFNVTSSGFSPSVTYSGQRSLSLRLVAGQSYRFHFSSKNGLDKAQYSQPIYFHPYANISNSAGSISTSSGNDRAAALMHSISNYNTTNNTTNYYIGTTDANGNVNNVYDPDIFNETTKTFTEPVTGQQYLCTDWQYCYSADLRGYWLELGDGTYSYNGKDIHTIILLYLDDALYIYGFDETKGYLDSAFSSAANDPDAFANMVFSFVDFKERYSYVIAEQQAPEICNHAYTSETVTAPTCTEQGLRRYTCELCGVTQDEKIPATGHTWEATEIVETVINESGDVTKLGYTVYTCSACGETYKQYDGTGQPGPPGPDDSGTSTGSGFWDRIKNAFLGALATLIEKILDFITKVLSAILDLVYDLLSFFFDFLTGTVISGISGFFSSFTDGSLFQFFQSEDGTGYALPEGVASVFAFFSAIFLCLPADLRYVLMFGIGLIIFLAVFKLVKS